METCIPTTATLDILRRNPASLALSSDMKTIVATWFINNSIGGVVSMVSQYAATGIFSNPASIYNLS